MTKIKIKTHTHASRSNESLGEGALELMTITIHPVEGIGKGSKRGQGKLE